MWIVWDQKKFDANVVKHGIELSLSAELFLSPTVEIEDEHKNYGEKRIICYGIIERRVYCCVYTDRGDTRRIISLRKANKEESNEYFEEVGP